MILLHDVEKQSGYLLYGGNRNKILNDIVQKADSAKRDVRYEDTHRESRAHIGHVEKERIKN